MGVIVIGNVTHVVVHLPAALPQYGVGHGGEELVQGRLDLGWWRSVVDAPHDHRHETNFTVGNPAEIVFVVPLGYGRGFAEVAVAHLTVMWTVPCHLIEVPGAGD